MSVAAISSEEVRLFVLRGVADGLAARGLAPEEVPDDFDLLVEGVVDSFGLLELIGELESAYGITIDFEEVDPDDLTMLGPFARHVAAQVAASSDGHAERAPVRLTAPTSGPPGAPRRALGAFAAGGYRGWIRVRDKVFSLLAGGTFAAFGSHSVCQLPLRLVGARRIAIGNGCFVGAGSWLQTLGDGDVALELGDRASIAGNCVISATSSVRIGAGVSFARGVYIADHAHAYDGSGEGVLDGALADVRPVEIGDGVWLGENVVVLPGARIGERAVIGANSVVGGDIPPFSLALGAPARVVRRF